MNETEEDDYDKEKGFDVELSEEIPDDDSEE